MPLLSNSKTRTRIMKLISALLLFLCLSLNVFGQAPQINLDEINAALANRVDVAKNSVGIIVGIITPEGRRYLTQGLSSKENGVRPSPETIFEIGSITKVFTSLLLADMVERGELRLDDPVAKYLPTVSVPNRGEKQMTLVDLATHTSGLPRDATNLDLNQLNPFATYGPDQLTEFLSGYKLTRDPGERFEYSNVGVSLLGYILTSRAGTSYEELLRSRILEPLGMKNTTVTLSTQQLERTAAGYDGALNPVSLWEVDKLVGAGSIRSTAADMLTFAAAQLGLIDNPLKPAMRRMLSITRSAATPSMDQHLGWAETRGGVLFSNGRRGGFTSALAIRPETGRAVIVLSNSTESVDDLAFHAVVPEYPLRRFDPPRTEIQVKDSVLESYVGVYEFAPGVSISVTRDKTRLFAQLTNQPRFELFAEQEAKFFVKVVNAQITFLKDPSGIVTGLVLHQNGANQPARKVR
jgi:serine-type D-Ala-D-Ala carboxypeptidase/endopeptidase